MLQDQLHLAIGVRSRLYRSQASTWTQRTHIWSSRVPHCAWFSTLSARLDTSTTMRRFVIGTTSARSMTRRSIAAQASPASVLGVARARRTPRAIERSHSRERLTSFGSPRAEHVKGASMNVDGLM